MNMFLIIAGICGGLVVLVVALIEIVFHFSIYRTRKKRGGGEPDGDKKI